MNNVRRLVETQIVEADAVLINKVDVVSEERLRQVTEMVLGLTLMWASSTVPPAPGRE